ncbi:GNAT family N-acetyltransferase [Nitratiruptor tergarcus]|uniref:Acetyltransferase (GNAT) domain-containing protein n=1 Tax=Nitratiruptor tergarcus DSM 16512 TaxID=1069081 RepID=A0A1W1WUM9_9BACT|nr:GNAT family N-acetyltransferase [Nitratiruptor tergarcus]SMC10034.1 Acetyltransferase (GNAT) domain-containing protein [Nitratiruptor tergarcus DSM 16512]
MNRVYSKELVQAWKKALIDTYGFEEYMDFLIQPTITGSKYLTYLPMLNYTDRTSDQVSDLLELAKDQNYQIRTLNPTYKEFKELDTVTLRILLKTYDEEELIKSYRKLAQRSIKKDRKNNKIEIKIDHDLDLFYALISAMYKDHGTPIFPKQFIINLHKYLGNKIHFYTFIEDSEVLGSYMVFVDNKILTFQLGGILNKFKKRHNGYYFQHKILVDIISKYDIDIVDFGRSGYNSGTYFFKTRFGAEPVKIDILTNHQKNVYQSYKLAAEIWKKLPKPLTDLIGPKLTKYLVDL